MSLITSTLTRIYAAAFSIENMRGPTNGTTVVTAGFLNRDWRLMLRPVYESAGESERHHFHPNGPGFYLEEELVHIKQDRKEMKTNSRFHARSQIRETTLKIFGKHGA